MPKRAELDDVQLRRRHPETRQSVLRALLSVGAAVLIGAAALAFDDTTGTQPRVAAASVTPAYLPSDSSGVIRMALVVGIVVLIFGQLWILRRRLAPRRLTVPVQARRNRPGSSRMSPNSSTRNFSSDPFADDF